MILQHPHEWKKYYSTAKLVALAVSNVTILRGIEFNPLLLEEKLNRPNTYLLFPGPHTKDCEEVQLDSQSTVVVIDGTWDEAGKIVHRNPALQKLPTLSFKKPLVSNYKIRKQPKESYLSTIESIAHLLKLNALAFGLNNKTTEYDSLFTGFNRMVDQQLSYFPRNRLVLD